MRQVRIDAGHCVPQLGKYKNNHKFLFFFL